MTIATQLAATLGGAIVTGLVCINGQALGQFLGVVAYPDRLRRLHGRATPQIGGIAILSGLMAWLVASCFLDGISELPLLKAVVLCAAGVGAVGLADDQTEISPIARVSLLMVFLAVALAVDPEFVTGSLNWASFSPTAVPLVGYLLLIAVSIAGMVNAVNMADGQNGVVGSMFVAWSSCLAIVSSGLAQDIAIVLAVLSAIFLVLNLQGKVFLGDCGSYGISFILGLLSILAQARGQVPPETIIVWFFIPVMDCLRLLIGRPLRGRSPFCGDRDHFHHRLMDKMGPTQAVLSYVGAVALSSLIATLMPRFALVCLCLLSAYYFSFAWLTDMNVMAASNNESASNNVVPLNTEAALDKRTRSQVG